MGKAGTCGQHHGANGCQAQRFGRAVQGEFMVIVRFREGASTTEQGKTYSIAGNRICSQASALTLTIPKAGT
jgi:hypothetical protein